jgi:hypothetical protein
MFHVKRCGGLVARAAEWPRQEGRKGAGTGGPGGDRSGADSQSRAGGFTCNGSPRPKPDSRQASSDGLRRPRGRAAKPGGFPRRVSRDARSAPLDRLDCWVDGRSLPGRPPVPRRISASAIRRNERKGVDRSPGESSGATLRCHLTGDSRGRSRAAASPEETLLREATSSRRGRNTPFPDRFT